MFTLNFIQFLKMELKTPYMSFQEILQNIE